MISKKDPVVKAKCIDDDGCMELFSVPIVFSGNCRMEIYRMVDRLLSCVTNKAFQFLSELNDLQSDDDGKTVFENKSDIPLRIVNLVLAPYNIVIEED